MSRIDAHEPNCIEDELRGWAFHANKRRALCGKKGRKFLVELEAALLALPEKRLARGVMAKRDATKVLSDCGDVCALGAVALKRAMDSGRSKGAAIAELAKASEEAALIGDTGWYEIERASESLKISMPLAFGVVEENDEGEGEWTRNVTPEQRYERVLAWVRAKLSGTPG